MSKQQDETLIQRIRRYNWQSQRKRTAEPEYDWYGDEADYLALTPAYEGPLKSYPPATEEQLRQTEDLLGFSLPPLLHALYMQIANGGFGPGYGIIGAIGGFPLEDGMGENIAQGYLDLMKTRTLIRLDEHEMRSEAHRYRQLKPLPAGQIVGWGNAARQFSTSTVKPERERRFLNEFPHEVWPDRLLPLCYWGCGICSYLDARTEYIFQGAASERHGHYVLVFSVVSLVDWFERWMAGESLQLL